MGWTDPAWLLALIVLYPIIKAGDLTFRSGKPVVNSDHYPGTGPGPLYLRRLTRLRVAAIVAVILALAGMTVPVPAHNRTIVLLIDVSESIGRTQVERARWAGLRIIRGLKAADRVGIVAFAGKPRLISGMTLPGPARAILETARLNAPQPQATDLGAALRLGKALLAECPGNPALVLVSDGHATKGGPALATVKTFSGIPVHTLGTGERASFFAEDLVIPELIRTGESIPIHWKVFSEKEQPCSVTMAVDGRVVDRRRITVPAGSHQLPLVIGGQEPGFHRLELQVTGLDGKPLLPGGRVQMFQVEGPARIMVISGAPRSPLSDALRIQGMNVWERRPEDLPELPGAVAGCAALVLDDVAATRLTVRQQQVIENYVKGGGGLVVIGGEHSLGRGEYYATRLEELLPVQTDTRQRLFFTRTNILYVIDHSGSMSEQIGNTTKHQAVIRGVAAAIAELSPNDEVGIISFDTEPKWALRFTPVHRRSEILDALARLEQGGGTNIAAAFEAILQSFSQPGPIRRHVVILTDGLTPQADFAQLTLALTAKGVSVSTIGVGEEINEPLLKDIAKWGQGEFYRAELDQIPKLIFRETLRVSRDLIQEGRFQPAPRNPGLMLGGLERRLPPVAGYLLTKAKGLAEVHLEAGNQDPLLASWRYGNGRVAVFTADSGRRWLAGWSGSEIYNRFWSRVVRTVARNEPDAELRMDAAVTAGTARIVVEAIGPDRELRSGLQLSGQTDDDDGPVFSLTETAPGRYETSIPLTKPGLHYFQIGDRTGATWNAGWIWNPDGTELQKRGPDYPTLAEISNLTGGRTLSLADPNPPSTGWVWRPVPLRDWLTLAALILFVIELGCRSLMLGQWPAARAFFSNWWMAKLQLVEQARNRQPESGPGAAGQQVMAAYRYLAERKKSRTGSERDQR
jgi:Ca-activated chloride channel family protein